MPDQPPEAVHDVAFVEDQVSVDDPPLATDARLAVSDTVGTGGGGSSEAEPPLPPPPPPPQEELRTANRTAKMIPKRPIYLTIFPPQINRPA